MDKLKRVLSRVNLSYHSIIVSIIVFVVVNIFWSYFFLWYSSNYSALGYLFSGISSLFASVVALYIAYGKHYSALEIIVEGSTIVINNPNAFPIVFTFKPTMIANYSFSSIDEMNRLFNCFPKCFYMYDGTNEKHGIQDMCTIPSLGTIVIRFAHHQFSKTCPRQIYPYHSVLFGYIFNLHVYGHNQDFSKVGRLSDLFHSVENS